MKKLALLTLAVLLAATSSLAASKPKTPKKPKPSPSPTASSGSTIEPISSATASPAATPLASVNDPIAIVGATIWTLDSAPVENGTILFRDGKIVDVGRNIEIPGKARRVDGSGKIVTPGLVDASTYIGAIEIDQVRQTLDYASADANPIHGAFRVTDGLNPDSALIPVERMEGVTSTITRPDGGILSGQGAWIHLDGARVEEMLIESPIALFGALDESAKAIGGNTRAGALRKLREALDDARFLRTHEAALDENRLRTLTASRLDLEALFPVLDKKIPLVLRAHRASDIQTALRFARDEKIRIVIEGGSEAWKVADELAAAKVPVVLQEMNDLPSSFESLSARFDNAAKLDAAGVTIAITPMSSHNARTIRQEAGLAAAWGLPKEKAIAAITRGPAEIYGESAKLGTLTRGKIADVVMWTGDPLEFSSQPVGVWIEGKEIPLRSRQTELLERYRTLPPSR